MQMLFDLSHIKPFLTLNQHKLYNILIITWHWINVFSNCHYQILNNFNYYRFVGVCRCVLVMLSCLVLTTVHWIAAMKAKLNSLPKFLLCWCKLGHCESLLWLLFFFLPSSERREISTTYGLEWHYWIHSSPNTSATQTLLSWCSQSQPRVPGNHQQH